MGDAFLVTASVERQLAASGRTLLDLVRQATVRPRVEHNHSEPRVIRSAVTNTFDGTYSHDGLVDVDTLQVWIARKGRPVGHSLLVDGATGVYDRFFAFRFYVPGERPYHAAHSAFSPAHGHLFLRFVSFWDYRAQKAVPEWDERRTARNLSEQARYAVAAICFYQRCHLSYVVDVHALGVLGGRGPEGDHYHVWQIPRAAGENLGSRVQWGESLAS